MAENYSDSQPSSNALARRGFLTAGGAALAGLGLSSLSARADSKGDPSGTAWLFEAPMNSKGEYELPPLTYALDALEPHIDAETTRLHHNIHFNSYKNGLNEALARMAEFREAGEFPQIAYWENSLAFNGAGYNLHLVFFAGLAPAGTTRPSQVFEDRIQESFGSMDAFKAQFSQTALTVQGSGWAILGWQPVGRKLMIIQAEKHQNQTLWNVIPIMALDVWEHAYYLKYQNRRGDYIKNWWEVVNWDYTARRLEAARQI